MGVSYVSYKDALFSLDFSFLRVRGCKLLCKNIHPCLGPCLLVLLKTSTIYFKNKASVMGLSPGVYANVSMQMSAFIISNFFTRTMLDKILI